MGDNMAGCDQGRQIVVFLLVQITAHDNHLQHVKRPSLLPPG